MTPRSAASDLGLYCLPMSNKGDSRLIWVKRPANNFKFKDSCTP